MRILLYIVILAAAFAVPLERLDVADLEPVEVIHLRSDDNGVTISTDTDAKGSGKDIAAALRDLHATTPGVVYLDTAEYLLISESAEREAEALRGILHGSIKLCTAEDADLENIARFLEVHGDLPALHDWKPGQSLPVYDDEKIIEKSEKSS